MALAHSLTGTLITDSSTWLALMPIVGGSVLGLVMGLQVGLPFDDHAPEPVRHAADGSNEPFLHHDPV